MTEGNKTYHIHLEPVGLDMEVEEGENILDAAFRQGIALPHGCKNGQCSSCKAVILGEADHDMLRYSTFALNDTEKDQGLTLLCRMQPYEDCTVELINYDEHLLKHAVPVRQFEATVTASEKLTSDMWHLVLDLNSDEGLTFFAGQYVDITLPKFEITRSFSMANTPSNGKRLEFIIKSYSDGRFSSKLADGGVQVGDVVNIEGPYGSCVRHEDETGTMYLIGGGSGMAPLLAILRDLVESGEQRPVRFFYGARTQADLFYNELIADLGAQLDDFSYIPALSDAEDDIDWQGEKGFVHDVVRSYMDDNPPDEDEDEVYACGPPQMVDALTPVLFVHDIDEDKIHYDRFTNTNTSTD